MGTFGKREERNRERRERRERERREIRERERRESERERSEVKKQIKLGCFRQKLHEKNVTKKSDIKVWQKKVWPKVNRLISRDLQYANLKIS